jgi:hypothetical protein
MRYPQSGGFMDINEIVVAIDEEIARLQQTKALLSGVPLQRKQSRPAKAAGNKATSFNPADFTAKPKRRTMSTGGRARIAAAQRARWAASKVAKKKATPKPSSTSATKKSAVKKSKAATQA